MDRLNMSHAECRRLWGAGECFAISLRAILSGDHTEADFEALVDHGRALVAEVLSLHPAERTGAQRFVASFVPSLIADDAASVRYFAAMGANLRMSLGTFTEMQRGEK